MGSDRSNWLLLLFLILGVLLPTGCVLWFMNDAANAQAAAARQSVTEAYRNQLPLLRDRVDEYWQARIAALDPRGSASAAEFARVVRTRLADSIVYLGANGQPVYPEPLPPLHPGLAHSPAQTQIRMLVRSGDKESALRIIEQQFVNGPLARATDSQGRLIAADEQMLALRLLPASRVGSALRRFTEYLNDYDHVGMPSAQRLFLMDEAQAMRPNQAFSNQDFPTMEAERLAGQYLEANVTPKDTWKLSAGRGRAVALYRTATIVAAVRDLLDRQSLSRSVRFDIQPPGAIGSGESIDAGMSLPAWRISFILLDSKPLDEAARARRVSYIWAGVLTAAAIVVMGVLMAGVFRRQMRLARLKTDLVAAVSHELKTPLASMRLLVDSLLDDPQVDPVKTRDYLRLIAGENERLTRLIENFLTFSRIERNRQRFEFAPVHPAGVIHAAVQLMRERSQSACEIEIEAPPDLPLLKADEDALLTVLLNLLDNAYKYTPAEKRISVRAHRGASEVLIEVADNGIGIAPRDQKRIFQRFYRVDQRLARETGGCGLGLSIVDYIVRAHGGSVSVRSKPGAGSAFLVRLPCSAELREAA